MEKISSVLTVAVVECGIVPAEYDLEIRCSNVFPCHNPFCRYRFYIARPRVGEQCGHENFNKLLAVTVSHKEIIYSYTLKAQYQINHCPKVAVLQNEISKPG